MESNQSDQDNQRYLQSVSPLQVNIDGGFWKPRMQMLGDKIIMNQYKLLIQTGRLENLARAAGKSSASFTGYYFNDSDVYKWLEAAIWVNAQKDQVDSRLTQAIEETIDLIVAAQQADGYLNSYFLFDKAGQRWSNLKDMHEMYCAGHLIQAAVADYRARKGTRLMKVARRLADHIYSIFGPGGRPGVPGHPEIELALVDLYRETNHKPYFELAQLFIDQRGKGIIGGNPYHLDHQPIRELELLTGHAVRAMYLCAGAADVYEFGGDKSLLDTLIRLWANMATSQVYVTGGLGARHEGESFGSAYELPNSRAYAETCAAIGSVMWNQRMFRMTREARFADLLEWTLLNAVLPGISLDGESYFYQNPLSDQGTTRRANWFPCACCPPNIARMLASIPGYMYAVGQDKGVPDIYIYGYAQNTASFELTNGTKVSLSQHTRYPWHGQVEIFILDCEYTGPIRLHLRIPAWSQGLSTKLLLNEHLLAPPTPGSFTVITRTFRAGDRIQLEFPMQPRWLSAHPFLVENAQKAVLSRGPLVYCLESADNPGSELRLVEAIKNGTFNELPELLPGIIGLTYPAFEHSIPGEWDNQLYLPYKSGTAAPRILEAVAIPYYAWANRQAGQMQVWVNYGRNSK